MRCSLRKLYEHKSNYVGEIKKQITGKTIAVTLKGEVSPGKESLKKILKPKGPLLILVDELLEYTTRAAGTPVKDSTLAAQTIAFTQELTEVAGVLDKICVVISLPSSVLEHYDANAETMFNQLQKVSGRLEKIYSPVRDSEVSQVIRRRLFSNVDLKKCESSISEFLEYAEKEEIPPFLSIKPHPFFGTYILIALSLGLGYTLFQLSEV